MDVLKTWLTMGLLDKTINIVLFGVILYLAGFGIIQFLKAIRKQKGKAEMSLGKDGLKVSINDENSKKMQEVDIEELTTASTSSPSINRIFDRLDKLEDSISYSALYRIPFTDHPVFHTLKRFMNRGFEFGSAEDQQEKLYITHIFLEECMSVVFYEKLLTWIQSIEDARATGKNGLEREDHCMRLTRGITDDIYLWIVEYNEKAKSIKIELPGGQTIYGIPEVFINKFDMWHQVHIETVIEKIRDVVYSDFYKTWQLKLLMILDHLDSVFLMTYQDARRTIAGLNGELEQEIEDKIQRERR